MRTLIILLIAGLLVQCKSDDSVPPNEGLSFEIDGLPTEFTSFLVTLQGADTIVKADIIGDEDHLLTFGILEEGAYGVTLSLFEGEDLYEDFETAQGTLFSGREAVFNLAVTGQTQNVDIQGPESTDADVNLEWSERYFHSINDPDRAVLTLSFPISTCELEIRLIPDYVDRQPVSTYIDYFIWDSDGGVAASAFAECVNDCDLIETINGFAEEVADGELANCENMTWEMIDSIIMIIYGDEAGDLVLFYQRWDADGNVVLPVDGRDASRIAQDRRAAK